ncbi:hypothetical protein D3C71_1291850 [compost metagenome]
MAKLHSWVFSNSSRCAGVITFSTRSRLCCGVSGVWVIGEILPLTLIAGGMPAVMNRSEARWCAISLRNEVKSMVDAVVFTAGSQWGMYQESVGGGNSAGPAA